MPLTVFDIKGVNGARRERIEAGVRHLHDPSAKRRMAAAERKRWAAFHAAQKSGTAKTASKRKLSAKARLARNLAKARAGEGWQGEEDCGSGVGHGRHHCRRPGRNRTAADRDSAA
jgi:hypothetical protein